MPDSLSSHVAPATGWKGLRENWRSDFLAAISVSFVAMPLGLGVAVASGAPPISGLISAIIGGLVVTLFRGSHLAINGPAAGLIAVILSAIQLLDDGSGRAFNYMLAATVMAGFIQVIIGLLKWGYIADIIPSSVIQGVMVAIGIIIVSSQIYVACGITPGEGGTVKVLQEFITRIPEINPIIFLIAIVGITVMVVIPRSKTKILHFFPASLWVLVLSIPLVFIFDFFESHEVNLFNTSYHIGPEYLIKLPDDLTNAVLFPDFSRIGSVEFWIAVVTISLIASIQTLAMAKAVDKLDPYRRKTSLNRDLIGVGIGTMISGAVGGLPIITVIVRSTVNVTNNAKTKWSNFYHGLLILIFIVLLTPVIQMIPLAAFAAILVYIGFRLASPKVFRKIYDMGVEQLIFMVVTIIITLYTDLLWGILGGTLFTLLVHSLLARMPIRDFLKMATKSDTHLYNKTNNSYELRIRGIANFLSVLSINKLLKKIPNGADVTIDLSGTRLVGMTFMEKMVSFLQSQRDTGGLVTIIGLGSHVSSSMHNRALKIFLHPLPGKLSTRQVHLKVLADKLGATFDSHVDWNTSYLRNFQFFEIRPIERKDNCIRGAFEKLEVQWEIADVTFNEGAAFSAEVYHSTVMTIRLPKQLPKFVMQKEGVFDKIFDRVMAFSGYRDIDFQFYPTFSKRILLMGENEDKIRKFFTAGIIEFFESEPVQHIECNGEALLIFIKMKLAPTDAVEEVIDFSKRLTPKLLNR
ncbi:MAG: SulP family inorganic anion transporter [Saprospiraceae bacterium]|nr:SulP family inorganic anion transporter [Saprospiraceae bacterium]